jgi:hypothetical protein
MGGERHLEAYVICRALSAVLYLSIFFFLWQTFTSKVLRASTTYRAGCELNEKMEGMNQKNLVQCWYKMDWHKKKHLRVSA